MEQPALNDSSTGRQQLAVLLVWACLLVLPIGRLVEVPVMLMAIAGLYLLVNHKLIRATEKGQAVTTWSKGKKPLTS